MNSIKKEEKAEQDLYRLRHTYTLTYTYRYTTWFVELDKVQEDGARKLLDYIDLNLDPRAHAGYLFHSCLHSVSVGFIVILFDTL